MSDEVAMTETAAKVDATAITRHLRDHLGELNGLSLTKLAKLLGIEDSQKFRLAVWDAQQALREELGVETRQERGCLVLVTDPEKRLRRAQRFRRTAYRKEQRALDVVSAIGTDGLDPALVRRIERAREVQSKAVGLKKLTDKRIVEADFLVVPATREPFPRGLPGRGSEGE